MRPRAAVRPACGGEGSLPAVSLPLPCLFPHPASGRPRAHCSQRGHGMRPCAQTGRGAGQDAHAGPGTSRGTEWVPHPLSTQRRHESRAQVWGCSFGTLPHRTPDPPAGTALLHAPRGRLLVLVGCWPGGGAPRCTCKAKATIRIMHSERDARRQESGQGHAHCVPSWAPRDTCCTQSTPQVRRQTQNKTAATQQVWVGWGKAPTESQELARSGRWRGV